MQRDLLERLLEGLRELYGERYRGLVLYGSYARGEADKGSNMDLLLLLDGDVNTAEEIIRAESLKWLPAMEAGYAASLFLIGVEKYELSERPFPRNARGEGILLS